MMPRFSPSRIAGRGCKGGALVPQVPFCLWSHCAEDARRIDKGLKQSLLTGRELLTACQKAKKGGVDLTDPAKVYEYFSLLTGAPACEAHRWKGICGVCISELASRLKRGVDLEDEDTLERIHLACAAEAAYRYALARYSAKGEMDFSAPGLSVSLNKRYLQDAEKIRDEMLALCGGLFEDGFFFSAV